ncbi:unnamed protein product [Mytilus edulis]|uniref:CCHC-type domain-containing protein n=1 Tax=Mytilus edulis TaxID=6550 RepID=A0A8S3TT02_MYTED|nr:unnamed protein product [Mytilus edulis]
MIEVRLNQQPRLVGENCTAYESSTAMKEQDFENPHLNDRFQQSQPPIEQDFYSQNRRTSNQNSRSLDNSVNYIQPPQPTGQLPVEHTINFNQQRQPVVLNFNQQRQQAVQLPVERIINHNRQRQLAVQLPVEQTNSYSRSNTRAIQLLGGFNRSPPTIVNQPVNHLNPPSTGQSLTPHTGLLHPSVKGNLVNNLHRPSNRANQPPCPRSTGQLQSTSQQNYTVPSYTAGRQKELHQVIDNQQHQPPINHPVHIPHISSQVPPKQQFVNRAGQHQQLSSTQWVSRGSPRPYITNRKFTDNNRCNISTMLLHLYIRLNSHLKHTIPAGESSSAFNNTKSCTGNSSIRCPRTFSTTGKGNWKAFYTKFTGYAEAAGSFKSAIDTWSVSNGATASSTTRRATTEHATDTKPTILNGYTYERKCDNLSDLVVLRIVGTIDQIVHSRVRGQGEGGGYNNRAGNRRTQTPDGACFCCHEQGHYKRDCPKLSNTPGRQPSHRTIKQHANQLR